MPSGSPMATTLGNITTPRQAGQYVRKAREAQGLTRAQLANAAGVSERLIASLELGDATGVRLDKLLSILGALGIALIAQGQTPTATRAKSKKPSEHINTQTSDVSKPATDNADRTYASLYAQIAAEQGVSLPTAKRS